MTSVPLIDDDKDLLAEKMRRVFPASPHRVENASTGVEDHQPIAATTPGFILLAVGLPHQTGQEVCKQIRARDVRIPVVFFILTRSADSAVESMRQRAYDDLIKPHSLQKLGRVMGKALKNVAGGAARSYHWLSAQPYP